MCYPSRKNLEQHQNGVQSPSLEDLIASAHASDDTPSVVLIRILMFFLMIALMASQLCSNVIHIPALMHRLYAFFASSVVIPRFQTETGSPSTSWPTVNRRRMRNHRRRKAARKPRRFASNQLVPARVVGISRTNSIRNLWWRRRPRRFEAVPVMPRALAKQTYRRQKR